MSRLNQALVGALVIQVAILLAVVLRPETPGIAPLSPLLGDFDAAALEKIAVFDAADGEETEPVIELERDGEEWSLASHHDYPVDEARVRELTGKLGALQTRGPMTTSPVRHSQLSVADDSFQRRVDLTIAGEKTSVLVGDPAGSRKTAVRLAGSDEVHAVTGLTAHAVSTQPRGWIVTDYFSVPQDRIEALRVTRPDLDLLLERDEESESGWRLASDAAEMEEEPLKQSKIDHLLRSISQVRADAPADPAADLSSPMATITVRVKGEEQEEGISVSSEERVLTVARGTGGRYLVKLDEQRQPVYVSHGVLLPLVGLELSELFGEEDEQQMQQQMQMQMQQQMQQLPMQQPPVQGVR